MSKSLHFASICYLPGAWRDFRLAFFGGGGGANDSIEALGGMVPSPPPGSVSGQPYQRLVIVTPPPTPHPHPTPTPSSAAATGCPGCPVVWRCQNHGYLLTITAVYENPAKKYLPATTTTKTTTSLQASRMLQRQSHVINGSSYSSSNDMSRPARRWVITSLFNTRFCILYLQILAVAAPP